MMRNHTTRMSRHHRRPRSNGGSNHPNNISMVKLNQHRAYHTLFANYNPYVIAEILNDVWIDPEYVLICVKKKSIT